MKTIFIIFLLFLSTYIYSSNEIHGYIETGYITRGYIHYKGWDLLPIQENIFVDIQIYTKIFFIETGGNIKTFAFFREKTYTFCPIFMEFTFFTKIKINNIEFGFQHICGHSIHIHNNNPRLDTGEEKIYFKIEF